NALKTRGEIGLEIVADPGCTGGGKPFTVSEACVLTPPDPGMVKRAGWVHDRVCRLPLNRPAGNCVARSPQLAAAPRILATARSRSDNRSGVVRLLPLLPPTRTSLYLSPAG